MHVIILVAPYRPGEKQRRMRNLLGMQFLQCNYGTREEDQPICSLATIPAGILCLSLGKIQFQSYLWQSCGKAEKFYRVLSWLEALRGLLILVSFHFDCARCSKERSSLAKRARG